MKALSIVAIVLSVVSIGMSYAAMSRSTESTRRADSNLKTVMELGQNTERIATMQSTVQDRLDQHQSELVMTRNALKDIVSLMAQP